MIGTIGRSATGIDFAALDHQPVYSVVLLLSPENQPQQHLQAASRELSRWEFFAEELRLAQKALGLITGEVTSDDLLGEIFGRFCIGK